MIKRTGLLLAFFFQVSLALYGQADGPGTIYNKFPAVSGEQVRLFTDRNIYCVNEKICFTAEYSCTVMPESLSLSKVLYFELISWNGARLAQMKLRLSGPSASGNIEIPSNIPSGNYYLRSYTKWMRNYSPLEYEYVPVKIVNPFRTETDEGPVDTSGQENLRSFSIMQRNLVSGIQCVTDKKEYNPGEKAELELMMTGPVQAGSYSYCISVVKAGAIDSAARYIEANLNDNEKTSVPGEYLPEIRGITISGEITDKSTKLPVKDAEVNLSETRYGVYFANYNTDESGRFYFSLPEIRGNHDFFIQADKPSDIHIDNDFCNKPVKLPYIPFGMNKEEMGFIREVLISQQLTEKFSISTDTTADSVPPKAKPLAFYGNKNVTYITDKYIELPDIEEFISEIVLEADIIYKKGKASYISMQRTLPGDYPPLILMDNIRISDSEQLLNTPLSKIERVEVINSDYVVEGSLYYGILSFYSRNMDFAGVDLNKNSMFFTYDCFSDTASGFDINKIPSGSGIPDRRDLIYWNPDIRLSAGKKTSVLFIIPDFSGEYEVFIRSKDYPGNDWITGRCSFTVK